MPLAAHVTRWLLGVGVSLGIGSIDVAARQPASPSASGCCDAMDVMIEAVWVGLRPFAGPLVVGLGLAAAGVVVAVRRRRR